VRDGTRAFHPAYPCVSSVPVPVGDGMLRLEVAVDSCSVEVFAADGEVVLTALVFPEGPQTFGPCPDGSAGG
jgi:sucrose-6-phosphate hydrolase SacC (GH32 family)